MRHKRFKLSILLVISLGLTKLNAQEAVTASGGNASGSGGSISYTVGQVVYTSSNSSSGSISQGVQQPYEISVISGIENLQGITLIAYPNPTTNNLTLNIENKEEKQFVASLFDINEKLLSKQVITNNETTIPMEQFSVSTYFLKVFDGKKEIKTFKIIKQ
jgi:hypothetical protein